VAAAPVAAPRDEEDGGRGRRGRRGGRGRGRDREPRAADAAGTVPAAAPAAVAAPSAPAATVAAAAPSAPAAKHEPRHERHERHERRPAIAIDQSIGRDGVRLTRDEAFSLVKRAVEALVTDDKPVMAEPVRVKARELLGRDSESLSDRNFTRILRDAHDAGAVDVRRRGDSFEVARVEGTHSVADQLTAAEAQAKADAPPPPPVAPAPRGVGAARGLPPKGGRGAKVPPSLLLLGVVDDTPAPVAAPVVEAAAEAAPAAKKGRTPAKKAAKADAGPKAKKAPAKPRAKKAAAKA
jgi:ribonuclease E